MPKVMLIDDDKNMLSLLDTLLALEGYDVSKLGADLSLEGQEIRYAIKRENPDLLMMDVHLNQVNGLDGFDLLRQLRRDSDLAEMKILISSGMDFSDKCIREGADGFVLKPYMPEELLVKIRRILGL
ncbi:MAG TPA: response regulator [Anaerolineales bacterium]